MKKLILAAAQKNGVDPNLVTAILIDEYARMGPDDLLDLLARIGIDTTVGLPQMRMSTAREMVELKLVKLETGISNSELYAALQDDKYAADFVAAYVNNIVKIRTRRHWNIAPEFIATCYSKGPATSESSDRGKQIVTTLLQVAMEILR